MLGLLPKSSWHYAIDVIRASIVNDVNSWRSHQELKMQSSPRRTPPLISDSERLFPRQSLYYEDVYCPDCNQNLHCRQQTEYRRRGQLEKPSIATDAIQSWENTLANFGLWKPFSCLMFNFYRGRIVRGACSQLMHSLQTNPSHRFTSNWYVWSIDKWHTI